MPATPPLPERLSRLIERASVKRYCDYKSMSGNELDNFEISIEAAHVAQGIVGPQGDFARAAAATELHDLLMGQVGTRTPCAAAPSVPD